MNRMCIAMLILGLIPAGYSCSRSAEKSEVESKVKKEARTLEMDVYKEAKNLEKEAKSLKKDVTQEVKGAEKDVKVLEEEKVIEKEMGKEENKIPAPAEDWGDEPVQQEP